MTPLVADSLSSEIDFGREYDRSRQHLRQRLAGSFRIFARLGFNEGVAGHITARDPEYCDRFWVNPLAVPFALLRASDMICVSHDGEIVAGTRPVNPAAFAIHSRVHMARPDVVSVVHAHSPYGKAWSAFRHLLEPLSQNACAFYEDHAVYDNYDGVVFDVEEGDRIGAALGDKKAVILSNHGNLTVGASIDEAVHWFVAMERTCREQLLVDASRRAPILMSPETARKTAASVGSAKAGRLSFRPMWDWIIHEEPDLLD
jgi:ribulose-5-phosphate 4-epimerase/fuculose-1-phosphate aldolase